MEDEKKTEEIIESVPFLVGNDKWGGRVEVLRFTITQPDGTSRSFINKRLVFTATGRYNNLPRNGCDEIIEAIKSASIVEHAAHETLLREINTRPRTTEQPHSLLKHARRSRT